MKGKRSEPVGTAAFGLWLLAITAPLIIQAIQKPLTATAAGGSQASRQTLAE